MKYANNILTSIALHFSIHNSINKYKQENNNNNNNLSKIVNNLFAI